MRIKSVLFTIGKLLVCDLVFMIGSILGGVVAGLLSIPTPAMPANIDPIRLSQSLPIVGLLITAALAYLSTQSGVGFFPRWLILGFFSWIAYGLNNFLEAKYFTPEAATSFVLVYNLLACFICSAGVAWLFKPTPPAETFGSKMKTFFSSRPVVSWAWRLVGALAVFPIAYFIFGLLVSPFVVSYYEQQYAGLALPKMEVMLVLATVRSFLFILCVLPVFIAWKGNRMTLFLALSVALFLLVGGVAMIQAIWLPAILRIAHSIEILADSITHAAGLVFLLAPGYLMISRLQPAPAQQ